MTKGKSISLTICFWLSMVWLTPVTSLGQTIEGFEIVNAETGQAIGSLKMDQTINLSWLPIRNISIRAIVTDGFGGSVRFWYNNQIFKTENFPPYTLTGDISGTYNQWTPAKGIHKLSAIPYSEANAKGTPGVGLAINFSVIDTLEAGILDSLLVERTGELKRWHRIALTFNGPDLSETSPLNPFLDFRLNVTFEHSSGKRYKVPGFFAASGNTAETSDSSGNKWRVYFAPDETGLWSYKVSFRQGLKIAVSDNENEGLPIAPIDAITDSFMVTGSDKQGADLRAKGLLRYVGDHHLQFAETGEYYIKGGADSPENFLAYNDFDNTPDNGGRRKNWEPHVVDWKPGDTTWQNGKGKGIIGAVNYLAAQGLNAFSFLTMSIRGDDQNVFPYINTSDFTRFDVSKLEQWEIVFEHAQKMGMYLHFKMQETENNNLLNSGNLGTERKLYYRELISRFSHHLALNWNIGEENTQTDQQRKDIAQYLYDHDPYRHPIVLHTYPGQQDKIYTVLLGDSSKLTGVSIQTDVSNVFAETRKWVEASAKTGKKWVVANDEQGGHTTGVAADAEYLGNRGTIADNSEIIRKDVLWGNLMAGGAGVEYYFGYETGETDLTAQDFRSRAKSWKYVSNALNFFKTHTRFNELNPMDNSISGWVLGIDGQQYVVYMRNGTNLSISLPAGIYDLKWYNPRTGGDLIDGEVSKVDSGNILTGIPPMEIGEDWVALINQSAIINLSTSTGDSVYMTTDSIMLSAEVSGEAADARTVDFYQDSLKIGTDSIAPYSFVWRNVQKGDYILAAQVFRDSRYLAESNKIRITVNEPPLPTGGVVFAVNSGGSDYTDSNGIIYRADTNFVGGSIYGTKSDLGNTIDDPLYQSERYGNFSYSVPLKNGTYEINLKFAEIYQQQSGLRVFDILIENHAVIQQLDIFAVAGFNNSYDIVRRVLIEDNNLNIVFRSVIDYAKLSGFYVREINESNPVLSFASEQALMSSSINNHTPLLVSVYPNPSRGTLTISSDARLPYSMAIYNSQGVPVYIGQVLNNNEKVDLSQFGAGTYVFQFWVEGRTITRKVILHHE
ncbi:DUF5060 domain-containing protein [Flavihumibacter sp. R14]|nr:DUF5060 domain-containing protein [Flavihumibacter soli]